MKTILLKFAGPMQSWGSDSHFETNVIWVLKIYYIILEDNKR